MPLTYYTIIWYLEKGYFFGQSTKVLYELCFAQVDTITNNRTINIYAKCSRQVLGV